MRCIVPQRTGFSIDYSNSERCAKGRDACTVNHRKPPATVSVGSDPGTCVSEESSGARTLELPGRVSEGFIQSSIL
ncbi:Uncharacterized protein DAT39_007390 [Clarias magur]|uniref:Uncharacterized protein n=1 Tax=Clarias magur TaxID=1594786 RepID=A0A8J4UTC2_CLAMG|nr:Uncharacterized protein DAT39_007390 [Clarias magur]